MFYKVKWEAYSWEKEKELLSSDLCNLLREYINERKTKCNGHNTNLYASSHSCSTYCSHCSEIKTNAHVLIGCEEEPFECRGESIGSTAMDDDDDILVNEVENQDERFEEKKHLSEGITNFDEVKHNVARRMDDNDNNHQLSKFILASNFNEQDIVKGSVEKVETCEDEIGNNVIPCVDKVDETSDKSSIVKEGVNTGCCTLGSSIDIYHDGDTHDSNEKTSSDCVTNKPKYHIESQSHVSDNNASLDTSELDVEGYPFQTTKDGDSSCTGKSCKGLMIAMFDHAESEAFNNHRNDIYSTRNNLDVQTKYALSNENLVSKINRSNDSISVGNILDLNINETAQLKDPKADSLDLDDVLKKSIFEETIQCDSEVMGDIKAQEHNVTDPLASYTNIPGFCRLNPIIFADKSSNLNSSGLREFNLATTVSNKKVILVDFCDRNLYFVLVYTSSIYFGPPL